MPTCIKCQVLTSTSKRCPHCRVCYCSKACRSADWSRHKAECISGERVSSDPASLNMTSSNTSLELQEFAAPSSRKKLFCGGRLCAKCYKCRDWHFSGNQHTWNWVCNWKNWNEADKDRWYDDYDKLFSKRDSATCDGRSAFDGGAGLDSLCGGDARLGRTIAGVGLASGGLGTSGFGRAFGGSLIFIRGDDLDGHLCLCEKH
ncbi:unnamed protein product [Adineta steineri]|uniref:MYND-type domain-containing protein n=1 Tax=Adineta steineri TaxID=433720 RepID=A0A813Q4W3_9BILA|nr:unnamed protein product [Adineta steineri]CAF4076413.1 unnamed protein product [Adineta steineri]